MKKHVLLIMSLFLSPMVLMAQEAEVDTFTNSVITPNFLIAIIAGVLLAMGFQFILTALSVALGITAIGDIKESYVENKYKVKDNDDDDDDDGMDTGTMITTGFGLWSAITVGLSLFGATALAINLSLIANTVIAITLGLVIWATFFILMFYLESKVVNSLVGGLINTATAGLRASGEAVKGVFSTSKESQMKNVAEDTVDKIRKDFSSTFDPKVINESVDEFFTRVDKSVPDYEQVKKDIKEIVEESDKRNEQVQKETSKKQGGGGQKWMAIQQVMDKAISQASDGDGSDNQGKMEKLKQLQRELKEAYGEGDNGEEKLEKVVAKFTPAEEEQVHGYIEKIKGILSKASPKDMDQGSNLQNKIMEVVKNPTVEGPKLASKLGDIDRDTIVEVLTANTALDKKQVEKYADKAEDLIQKIKQQIGGSGDGRDHGSKITDASALRVQHKDDHSDMKMKLEKELSKMVNNTGKPDINFAMLTSYFQGKMDDQGDKLSSVKRKLQNMDRDSLVSVVTSNTKIDEKDIDKVVQSYEDAKNNVLDRIQKIEDEANRRLENLKRKAVIQAENTRKNAAAAAWWLVISALISAGAAIGGSMVALG